VTGPTSEAGRPAALILAGGAARRLGGGDKPLLDVGGETMLARVIAGLRAEPVGAVALSANGDPARFAAFGLPVLEDGRFAGAGPLAGLLAGLDWAAGQGVSALLTVPGDTPLLPAGLVRGLASPPACARAGDGTAQYLVALWPVAARAALRVRLESGARKVGAFAAALGMREVAFPAAPAEAFLNVNTPADLAAARAVRSAAERS
jgi:molybdopterin-guanine dinucleotide biosynthesis protein A